MINYYLEKISKQNNKKIDSINKKGLELLIDYDWPGNVRELRNVVERMVVLANSNKLTEKNVPIDITEQALSNINKAIETGDTSLESVEKQYILKVLNEVNGNKSKAAEKLKISRRTLYRKLEEYEL